jgi:hypothetical protein
MYFGHIISSRFCDKSFYTNQRTETEVLQIIFHGMSEMKVLHDQYLLKKKKCATAIFEYVPEYCQLLVYCRISSSVVGL